MTDQRPITVSIPFSIPNDDGTNFSSAIHFTKAEFDALTPTDVKAIQAGTHKTARAQHTAWRRALREAATAPPETEGERHRRLRLERADALERQAAIDRELASVDAPAGDTAKT